MHIQGLVTCYNRVNKTFNIIRSLLSQELPNGYSLRITLVDDNSVDGTKECIARHYPEVEIISGNGNLYWAGGMRYGWEKSVKHKDFDMLLVFNDDIILKDNFVINSLLDDIKNSKAQIINNKFTISAAFENTDGNLVTYGGFKHCSSWHKLRFKKVFPCGKPLVVDTINMNLVLISREALDDIGFLSPLFKHGGADMDFGLRLKKSGGINLLSSKVFGKCDLNPKKGTSQEEGIGYFECLRRLISIKEQPIKQRYYYYKEHAGFFWFFLFLMPYIRVLLRGKN